MNFLRDILRNHYEIDLDASALHSSSSSSSTTPSPCLQPRVHMRGLAWDESQPTLTGGLPNPIQCARGRPTTPTPTPDPTPASCTGSAPSTADALSAKISNLQQFLNRPHTHTERSGYATGEGSSHRTDTASLSSGRSTYCESFFVVVCLLCVYALVLPHDSREHVLMAMVIIATLGIHPQFSAT